MKKQLFVAIGAMLLSGMLAAQNNMNKNVTSSTEKTENPATVAGPVFKWEQTSVNLGKIPQGIPVSITYAFTNSGKEPLIITSVAAGCNCTATDWTKEAVAPGKKGIVKLTYNAAAAGQFTKSVNVQANTNPASIILMFNGEVEAKVNP